MSMPEHDITHHLLDPLGPTSHGRGSDAKIDLMSDRYERGVLLWHPDDNPDMSPEAVEKDQHGDECHSLLWSDRQPPDAHRRHGNIPSTEEETYEDE